ncbi:MAG: GNAT family N-acetyltransferase [Luteitalea sp.]|nr:GNAT family N-acetyltransferase [Luteitalea sp.]
MSSACSTRLAAASLRRAACRVRPAAPERPPPRREGAMAPSIERARERDTDALLDFLRASELPTAGLVDHLRTTIVAREGTKIVGSAALEVYPDGALLRSVAVASEMQGRGLGSDLTRTAIRMAHDLHAPAIYLLTTTAGRYFPKFGFERIPRAGVPAGVQRSVEFASACPSSATVMRKPLEAA